ncbi:hypothetical protein FCM22_04045, partial [Mycoplasma bovis]|nr:hypothetical protein [Mycoplasmopsis bovis]MBT1365195.1 hypothetical protein [Mycoplasmopsis bovis]
PGENKTPGESKTPMGKPEEGSTNNGIGWGENHPWGKDEDDLEKSKQESDEAEREGEDSEAESEKGSDTESSKKDKDPKTESSTKAKDPETQSGKPVVKPMVRVTENTSENSKVKKVYKYWDGVTPEDKKKAIESGKFWAEHWELE